MKTALALEKTVNEALFKLHEVAASNKDDEVSYVPEIFRPCILLRGPCQLAAHGRMLPMLPGTRF